MSDRGLESQSKNLEATENLSQSPIQSESKRGEEVETPVESEAETETRPPTPYHYRRIPFMNYEAIRQLGDQPFTIEAMQDSKLIDQILLAENVQRLQQRSTYKYRRWLEKRGRELSTDAQEKLAGYVYVREVIDILAYYVNGAFGIAGGQFLDQLRFMLKVYKLVKARPIIDWCGIAESTLSSWCSKASVNPQALRASGHLVLKLLVKLAQG
jgi:hypothetical protein